MTAIIWLIDEWVENMITDFKVQLVNRKIFQNVK